MEMSNVSNINVGFDGHGSQNLKVEEAAPAKIVKMEEVRPELQPGEPEDKTASMPSLKTAVEKINSATNSCEAVFGIHEGTNRVTIKMVDKETKEVIKEFPAEETLDLIAKAWDLAGIMVDEKR